MAKFKPTRLQSWLYGSGNFIVASIGFIAYSIVLFVIRRDREYARNPSSQIMFHLGFTDIVPLVIHATTGIFIILRKEFPDTINHIVGGVCNGMWFPMLGFTCYLAIHRFCAIVLPTKTFKFFTQRNTFAIICCIWILFPVFGGVQISPYASYTWGTAELAWDYYPKNFLTPVVFLLDHYLILLTSTVSIVVYTIVFSYIFTSTARRPSVREMAITLQVFILCTYTVVCFVIWQYIEPNFMPEDPRSWYWTNMLWIVWNSMNPFIYLTFNTRLRHRVKGLILCGQMSSERGVTTVMPMMLSRCSNDNTWSWAVVTIILCAYGVFKEFRPTEPYLYQYEHITLNISEDVLNGKVYPIWTYSYLVALIPVFLLTDLLVYKPVIILETLSYMTVWLLLIFGRTVLNQQILEFFYGWATAGEIAYFAYIYVKVDKKDYPKVTGYTRAALLFGRFLSYVVSAPLILTGWSSYQTLNYISFVSLCIALVFALALPWIPWRKAFDRIVQVDQSLDWPDEPTYGLYVKTHFRHLWKNAKIVYSNVFNVRWSVWWALASCMNFQIGNYTQTLWSEAQGVAHQKMFNGFAEAACPLIGIPLVLLMRKIPLDWKKWGEVCLFVISLLDAGILFAMSKTDILVIMYAGYVVYRVLYQTTITIAQFNLAVALVGDTFGLVFGFNMFLALALQSLLTFVVTDSKGLAMSIRPQFEVYSGCHLFIALVFLCPLLWRLGKMLRRRSAQSFEETS